MTYLFDTNVWIKILKGRDRVLLERVTSCTREKISSCSTVRAEPFHGAEKYDIPEARKSQLSRMLAVYPSLPFDDAAAEKYGEIRHFLEKKRCVIGPYDMQTAAIALVHDLTLVTGNVSEFSRLPDLKVEDWSGDGN